MMVGESGMHHWRWCTRGDTPEVMPFKSFENSGEFWGSKTFWRFHYWVDIPSALGLVQSLITFSFAWELAFKFESDGHDFDGAYCHNHWSSIILPLSHKQQNDFMSYIIWFNFDQGRANHWVQRRGDHERSFLFSCFQYPPTRTYQDQDQDRTYLAHTPERGHIILKTTRARPMTTICR